MSTTYNPTYMKAYYAAHRPASRHRNFMKRYGLSLAEFEAMKEDQGGLCAICRGEQNQNGSRQRINPDEPRELAVDHDHKTGEIRGLLCDSCNRALGLMKDEPERMHKAADYLATWVKG